MKIIDQRHFIFYIDSFSFKFLPSNSLKRAKKYGKTKIPYYHEKNINSKHFLLDPPLNYLSIEGSTNAVAVFYQ